MCGKTRLNPFKMPQVWYEKDQKMTIFHFVYKLIRFCLNNNKNQNGFLCTPVLRNDMRQEMEKKQERLVGKLCEFKRN